MSNPRPLGLFLIGIFKLAKGALVLALVIGVFKLINKDVDGLFLELISKLHINAEHRFIQNILFHLSLIDNHTLEAISTVGLVFASLLLTEGFGLLFQKLWAEFLTVAETAIFIPFEIFEIMRRATVTRFTVLLINIGIVIYLLFLILRKSNARKALR
jgi:Predicted membrane protein